MDDLRIGSLGYIDSLAGGSKDGSKKRPKHKNADPEEAPADVVTLHSGADEDEEEQPPAYLPGPSAKP